MKLILDSDICNKFGFTIDEAAVFSLIIRGISVKSVVSSLMKKGFIVQNIFDNKPLIASGMSEKFSNMLLKCGGVIEDDFDYIECVKEMRELYPKGSKKINNSSYPWRGNIKDCASALRWMRLTYQSSEGDLYTKEQIINATKRYVDSFNGNYEDNQMRIMRNFIRLRYSEPDEQGIPRQKYQSDLATWIENEDDPDFKPTYSGVLLN